MIFNLVKYQSILYLTMSIWKYWHRLPIELQQYILEYDDTYNVYFTKNILLNIWKTSWFKWQDMLLENICITSYNAVKLATDYLFHHIGVFEGYLPSKPCIYFTNDIQLMFLQINEFPMTICIWCKQTYMINLRIYDIHSYNDKYGEGYYDENELDVYEDNGYHIMILYR